MISKTEQLSDVMKRSVYVQFLQNNYKLLLGCLLLAVFLVFLTYPGILYSDSYSRIRMADNVNDWLYAFFSGNRDLTTGREWLTITPSFFIYIVKRMTGSIAPYTFLQCFLFFFLIIAFAKKLVSGHKIYMILSLLATPVFYAFSVYYEASVGCITAFLALILLIWKWEEMELRADCVITILFIIFTSFIVFGYRANAFTILPVLFTVIYVKGKKRFRTVWMMTAVLAGFLLVSLIPQILHIDTMSSYASGFLWETVSVIQSMDEEKQQHYITYLDDIFGDGVTKSAIEVNCYKESTASINSILGSVFSLETISEEENTKKILSRYIELAGKEPEIFFQTKCIFIAHTMGIGAPINMWEYDYNRWEQMMQYGFNDSSQRRWFVDYFLSYMSFMKVYRTPWFLFGISLFLIILWRFRYLTDKKGITLQEVLFLTAVFYYGAYVLNTQSFEFRYFFPAWLLLYFVIVSLIIEIGSQRSLWYKITVIVLIFYFSAGFLGGIGQLNKEGDAAVVYVENEGILLKNTDGQSVYYLNDNLYFIADWSADTNFTYFLHYFDSDGNMINHDFYYKDYALYTSIFRKRIAVRTIPQQNIISLEFGQYYGETGFWGESVILSDLVSVFSDTSERGSQ